ncbi:MAG: hypothetical protein NTX59_08600, partial [Elusimicrobia bacterium]|nr:hypothetical protein [Elusimicrobiota bacterium]
MRKILSRKVTMIVAVAACVLIALLVTLLKSVLRIDDILAAYDEKAKYGELTIGYPLNKTLFPPEIAPTT